VNKWDKNYLNMAKLVSSWSKDPSSRIGAVAVNDKGQILTTGYNGFPRGIADNERLNDRPVKYKYIVHAEQNAIYNATYNGVSLHNATMYVSGLPCCSDCAKAIIQVGVKRVVMDGDIDNERWSESVELTLDMFTEAGVEYEFDKGTEVD
jgi:dCMP deaminase|tara:strand:- start:203 stop:652 length:450 start_codon:yes stop_codon:yes gene_type:complete